MPDLTLRGTIHRALALFALLTALVAPRAARATYIPVPDDVPALGGDDMLVFESDGMQHDDAIDMALAPNGDYYAAVTVSAQGQGSDIHVYRSSDGGDTWSLWGSKGVGMTQSFLRPELRITESPVAHVVLVYEYVDGDVWSVNASHSPTGPSAAWNSQYILHDVATDFTRPALTSVEGPGGTVLYLAARDNQGTGAGRIWFSRSLDQGVSWEAPYVIGPLGAAAALNYDRPDIAADELGNVHVAWLVESRDDLLYDDGIYYRHADNWGIALPTWDGVRVVEGVNDGVRSRQPGLACRPNGSKVLLATHRSEGGTPGHVQFTADGDGTNWSGATYVTNSAGYYEPQLLSHPTGGWLATGASHWVPDNVFSAYAISRSLTNAPSSWLTPFFMADAKRDDLISHHAVAVIDPTRQNGIALLWSDVDATNHGLLRFDAQWRNGPGYPNLDAGFPKPIAAQPLTHPALHEVNPFRVGPEMVYADANGLVHVIDTESGEDVPGWPQAIGPVAFGQTVAVGDLDGNGIFDVVASNADGRVYAWRGDGVLLPGWPVQVGNSPNYVSLGAVSKLTNLDVVVADDERITLLRPNGDVIEHGNWPVVLPASVVGPASLGDVDDDGFLEVVATMSQGVAVFEEDGSAGWMGVFAPGMVTPTALGDLDADGDLELVIPGGDGMVHAYHHTGAAVAGFWPQMTQMGQPVVGLALAEIDAAMGAEVAALNISGAAHLFRSTGFPYTGFPFLTGGAAYYAAPILDDVDGDRPELIAGDVNGFARGFKESALDLGGWPKDLGSMVRWAAVSGDLDADGQQKVMFLTQTEIVKVTVNDVADTAEDRRWAMFAHDARRTSCADTTFDTVTAAPEVRESIIHFAPPAPNPAFGNTRLSYRLPGSAEVRLEIFDARGRRVRTVFAGNQGAGDHSLAWDTRDGGGERVSQGQYYGRLMVKGSGIDDTLTQKITVVR